MQEDLVVEERWTQSGTEIQLAEEHERRACIVRGACQTWRGATAVGRSLSSILEVASVMHAAERWVEGESVQVSRFTVCGDAFVQPGKSDNDVHADIEC